MIGKDLLDYPGIFFSRMLFVAVVVFSFWNPLGYSIYNWFIGEHETLWQATLNVDFIKGFFIAVYIALFLYFAIQTYIGLGRLGIIVFSVLLALAVFALNDALGVNLLSGSALSWVVLVVVTTFISIGLSAAPINRRLTGTYVTTDSDVE